MCGMLALAIILSGQTAEVTLESGSAMWILVVIFGLFDVITTINDGYNIRTLIEKAKECVE